MFQKILGFFDKLNNSHLGNKKVLENRVNFNKDFFDKAAGLYIENIKGFRTNLLALSGGLIAFLSFAYSNAMTTGINLSFKIGFIGIFLAIVFAIIISVVLALFDIILLKKKIDFIEQFHHKLLLFLGHIRKIEFTSEEAKEYNELNNTFTENLKKVYGSLFKYIDIVINILFVASLMVGLTGFAIYYISLLWK